MVSTLKTVIVAVGLAIWFGLPSSPASADEANCGSNRDAVCVSTMVPEVDPAHVWSLLSGNLKYVLYYFECLGGDQLSCTVVGGELIAGRELPYDQDAGLALLGPSCDIGHEFACVAVGNYLKETAAGKADPQLVAQLTRRACRANAHFFENEATLYVDGALFPVDHAKAAEIHYYACERKAGGSCYLLGQFHLEGLAPDSSESVGLDLVERSCTYGSANGCFDMGAQLYESASKPKR